MQNKVLGKTYAALFRSAHEKNKPTRKSGRSFSEELNHRLPHLPSHRSGSKTITTEQAKRLARYAPLIKNAAARHGVPIELICGVILQESGGNARAISPAGARGLMQLMPQTARRFGVRNSFDPIQNIEGGTKYLRFLLDRFKGNVELALAGYNSGEQNVEKYGMRIPPFRETQNYVPTVLNYARAMAEMLKPTLPTPSLAIRNKLA